MGSDQVGEGHVIRLRGPWSDEGGRRVRLPAVWGEAIGDSESVTLSRVFKRPPRLDAADIERFVLRFESPQRIEQAQVNGAEVTDGDDLLCMLEASNQFSVSLVREDATAAILEVWLEIK
ncbi:MAG: hypothetical protein AAGJ46_19590 [Planctomycetota bacterium]